MPYLDSYYRLWTGPFPFTRESVTQNAPKTFGVYEVLYTLPEGGDPHVAYIGIATGATIRDRLRKHVTQQGNWGLARIGDPASFQFVYYLCDAESARQIESHVVTVAKPPFNVRPEYQHFIPSIMVH